MSVRMPELDAEILGRRDRIVTALRSIVPGEGVIAGEREMRPYETDGLTAYRQLPMVVVLPETTQQVAEVLRYCHDEGIKVVPRGAGTSLSGGALPLGDGVLLGMAKFNRIREIDFENRVAVVEPGVTNLAVTNAVAHAGFYYAPDPSSQIACTIGGNVAENAGGAHCLKYGFTTTHVLGMDVVLPTGEMVTVGSMVPDAPGYDLTGVFVGSEGTLGVATKIVLRIVERPETVQVLLAAFDSIAQAGQTVSDVIAAGMLPAAMEIMDRLSAHASEQAAHPNYPVCEALLLIELDGIAVEVDAQMAQVRRLCEKNGASEVRLAQSAQERALIWKGRKAAFAAMGRISPNYIVQDGVIPRTALPEVLEKIGQMAAEVKLRVANVFHAGDGNLHPMVLYDQAIPGQEEIALDLSYRILYLCVDHGGSITGEHGVGKEKQQAMGYMYSEPDLETMQRVRHAFDPENIANPDKVFPRTKLCGEKTGPYTPHPLEKAGVAEFF